MKIGFIGTGLLGAPMAMSVLDTDHELTVWNRTKSKTDELVKAGATLADTPAEVFSSSECVILMVTDGPAIRDVLSVQGVSEAIRETTIIQMGTISPAESKQIEIDIKKMGGEYFEAPVLGSIPHAKQKKLLVMAGASKEQYKKWLPVLEIFGPPTLVGPVGQGAALKLAMNQLIASHIAGFSLSLGLVKTEGVEIDTFLNILRDSALYAPMFDNKLKNILSGTYDNPNFPAKHMLKDINLIAAAADQVGLDTRAVVAIKELFEKNINEGNGELDYSSVFEAIFPKIN
jgi:3-hydroxyisobutyrate dehydrogenase